MKKKQIIMLLSILVVIAGSICFFCFHSRIIDTYSQDNKTMKIYSNGRVAANGFDEKDVVIAAIDLASRNKLKSAYYVYKYILDRDKDNFSGYIGMANIYESLNNYNEALKYVDEIESIAKGKEDKYEVIRAEYHKAELYRLKTEYEGSTAAGRAIEYYLKTIRDGNEFSGTKIQRMLLDETIKRSLEEVANLYYKQADYRNAISCFNSLLDSDNTDLNKVNLFSYKVFLCNIYLEQYDQIHDSLNYYNRYYEGAGNIPLFALCFYNIKTNNLEEARRIMSDLTERMENKSKENDDFFQLKWLEGELYEASGENENARNIFIELYEDNPSFIFDAEEQNRIKRLNINISEIAKALNAEMEESYSRTIQ